MDQDTRFFIQIFFLMVEIAVSAVCGIAIGVGICNARYLGGSVWSHIHVAVIMMTCTMVICTLAIIYLPRKKT
jgi:hypothetical protein